MVDNSVAAAREYFGLGPAEPQEREITLLDKTKLKFAPGTSDKRYNHTFIKITQKLFLLRDYTTFQNLILKLNVK